MSKTKQIYYVEVFPDYHQYGWPGGVGWPCAMWNEENFDIAGRGGEAILSKFTDHLNYLNKTGQSFCVGEKKAECTLQSLVVMIDLSRLSVCERKRC